MNPLQGLVEQTKVQKRLAAERKRTEVLHAPLPQARISDSPRPDALVLCTIETTCESCGSIYSHPTRNLLVRHGRSYTQLIKSTLFYSDVPKEQILRREVSAKCCKCFGPVELSKEF